MGNELRGAARDALVTTAIAHLAKLGPVGVQPQEICAELGLSKALVNYHFGGREGLIAEAVATACERHSAELGRLADRIDTGASPSATMEALIEHQVRWGGEQPGLVAAASHPDIAVGRGTLTDEQRQRMAESGERNFAAVHKVLVAARAELGGGREFGSDAEARQLAAIVGWVTLGMLTWNSGMFLPTSTEEMAAGFEHTRQQLYALLRAALAR